MTRAAPALLAALLLTGCALVDQTTFAPSPEATPQAPQAAQPAAQVDPRAPLLTIEYVTPDPHYQELLRYAVRAAEARDRAVRYDVIAVVRTMDEAGPAQDHAAAVMRAIMAERVPAARIQLGLRADPTLTATQVRVYVR